MTSEIHRKLQDARIETYAQILEASPIYRVLRALNITATPEPPPGIFDDVRVLVVDVETTGLDATVDTIIIVSTKIEKEGIFRFVMRPARTG